MSVLLNEMADKYAEVVGKYSTLVDKHIALLEELSAIKAKRVKLPQRYNGTADWDTRTMREWMNPMGYYMKADDVIKMLWDAGITPGETL